MGTQEERVKSVDISLKPATEAILLDFSYKSLCAFVGNILDK